MKIHIIIIILLFSIRGIAQNLVPNNSFENLTSCPSNQGQLNLAIPWFSPTDSSIIPMSDVFNSCCLQSYSVGVPQNSRGYQYPRTGNGYAGIAVYASYMKAREYISVKLDSTLSTGKKYYIGYYVSLSDYDTTIQANGGSRYAIDCLGTYISDTAIHLYTTYIIPVIPQIINPADHFLSDTINWMLVSGKYIAHGGEQYITIGNFNDDSTTNYIKVSDSHALGAYYYIDDVFVYKCDTDTTDTIYHPPFFKVYPSLATELIYLDYNKLEINNTHFVLYDVCGRKVKDIALAATTAKQSVDITSLSAGMYLYQLVINKGVSFPGKIVVRK